MQKYIALLVILTVFFQFLGRLTSSVILSKSTGYLSCIPINLEAIDYSMSYISNLRSCVIKPSLHTNFSSESLESNLSTELLYNTTVSIKSYGALGDGINDDGPALLKAINSSARTIIIPKSSNYYKIDGLAKVSGRHGKVIIAIGAKILNNDISKPSWLFQNCHDIKIEGGIWGYVIQPTANGGNSQHTFQFDQCQNIELSKIHVTGSPEMGIAITSSNHVIVQNCIIEKTFRDGIYSHYSANVKYLNNILRDIKDDAMSFHDYGISDQKNILNKYGYDQSSNLLVEGNKVTNSYQGFGSIGSAGVIVRSNTFKNTLLSGISIVNSKELFNNGTALAKNSKILNNIIINACSNITINKTKFSNNGQASTGRAAIFVGSLGNNNQVNQGEVKRIANIVVSNNKIYNSGANGFWADLIDTFQFTNNTFVNCAGSIPAQSLSGDVIEMRRCTDVFLNGNIVLDTRKPVHHVHGYVLDNISGKSGGWLVRGTVSGEKVLSGISLEKIQTLSKKSNVKYK